MRRRSEFVWLTMGVYCAYHWQTIRSHPANKPDWRRDKLILLKAKRLAIWSFF